MDKDDQAIHIIGGGIAGLAAAVYLIRDAGRSAESIHIYEEGAPLAQQRQTSGNTVGGALDASGDRHSGYLMRGGRMFEEKYRCTYDLLRDIQLPTGVSASKDIEDFSKTFGWKSTMRLVGPGCKNLNVTSMGFDWRDRFDLLKLFLASEESLGRKRINEVMQPHFFTSNFWLMWCSMFSFQPWHSAVEMHRYLRRFVHLFPQISDLSCVWHTRFNQYDSMVKPVKKWLEEQKVHFDYGSVVRDMDFEADGDGGYRVTSLAVSKNGKDEKIKVGPGDLVFLTNGSMTDGASIGSKTQSAALNTSLGGAWTLWKNLAAKDGPTKGKFGNPDNFLGPLDETKWPSFTVTTKTPLFAEKLKQLTGRDYGREGLITFKDSCWMLTIHPHFFPVFETDVGQEPVYVWWGYGLSPDQQGDFVKKKMSDCSGQEFLEEALRHLPFSTEEREEIIAKSEAIPCMMPLITSQFMPRGQGDRPDVAPEGSRNFAFMGQYAEAPDDCVFTVEYSVRTAKMAVKALLDRNGEGSRVVVEDMYKGWLNPIVSLRAFLVSIRPAWWPIS